MYMYDHHKYCTYTELTNKFLAISEKFFAEVTKFTVAMLLDERDLVNNMPSCEQKWLAQISTCIAGILSFKNYRYYMHKYMYVVEQAYKEENIMHEYDTFTNCC